MGPKGEILVEIIYEQDVPFRCSIDSQPQFPSPNPSKTHTIPIMQFFNYPGTESNSESFHYSQAVKIGTMVKTSGQGGWDESGKITSDVEKQVAVAFENVEKALKEVDSRLSWENVYAVRSYHINMEETFEMVTSNFKKFLPGNRPVWTCVEIGKLGIEGMVIEIEVEAHCAF